MFSVLRIVLLVSIVVTAWARLAAERRATGRLRSAAPPSTESLREEVRHALSSALGDGHGVEQRHLDAVRNKLSHTWASLPKNSFGLVERRSMRYAVHRYFLQMHHISVIGLETASDQGSNTEAALLTKYVPRYVRNVLEGKAATSGFSIADAVALIAVLEQLILDSASALLTTLYKVHNVDIGATVPFETVDRIVKEYMLHWTTGQTDELAIKDSHEKGVGTGREWDPITTLAERALRSFMFVRQLEPRSYLRERTSGGATWHPLFPEFSFTDVQTMISGIIHTFGHYWAPECQKMKNALVTNDLSQSGRLLLSDFHSTPTGGQWEFAESADYLRQLGALDETSGWRGARVIITNYMQATSNCVVLAPHYRVCCANECEEHMDELETIIGAPSAEPELLLSAVENISATWYGDEDLADTDYYEDYEDDYAEYGYGEPAVGNRRPELPSMLKEQLYDISKAQGGKVPLHGRLFAQWLHYAFPHECPYPHKSGTINPMTPEEYGESYKASHEEIETHFQKAEELYEMEEGDAVDNDADFMSQWDHEEELLAEHVGLLAPWEKSRRILLVVVLIPLVLVAIYNGNLVTQKTDSRAPVKFC